MQFPFDVQECLLELVLPDHFIFDDENGVRTNKTINISPRCEDTKRSPLYTGALKEMKIEQVRSWVLSDVLVEVIECTQMLERNFSSDEWSVSDVSISSNEYEFTVFDKMGKRCDY